MNIRKFLCRCALEFAALIYRRTKSLSFRPLEWLGFDLGRGNLNSRRWDCLGLLPAQGKEFPAWFILDMRAWHHRFFYITGRYYEHHVLTWMRESLQPGDTFIDIGANIGMLSLYASHLVGEGGRCIAVEAQPQAFELLRAHVAINRTRNVDLHLSAMGSKANAGTEATFNVPVYQAGGQTAESVLGTMREVEGSSDEATWQSISVAVQAADDLLSDIPAEARGACKIDVEGMEAEVLDGMAEFIRTHPRICYSVEMTPEWLQSVSGVTVEDVCAFFTPYGLAPHRWSGGLKGEWIRCDSFPNKGQYDVVFKRTAEV